MSRPMIQNATLSPPRKTIAVLFLAVFTAFSPNAPATAIAWSPVGNAGNVPDTTVMSDGTSGYGAVPYAYNIGTYDVTTPTALPPTIVRTDSRQVPIQDRSESEPASFHATPRRLSERTIDAQ